MKQESLDTKTLSDSIEDETSLRNDAMEIIQAGIQACLPDEAVRRALAGRSFDSGNVYVVALGKAAWQMAACCAEQLGEKLTAGIVITKYGHSKAPIPRCAIYEAGHPIPDENSFRATQAAVDLVSGLSATDTVVLLVSGGGSALFELPLISPEELQDITRQLLACGADITKMNTIRKRLSAVKGGRFGALCQPAKVFSIVLSDILRDPLDMIASGPAYPDSSTCQQALEIVEEYQLRLSDNARHQLLRETPKCLENVETVVTGSVTQLCLETARKCESLGYEARILTQTMECQAKDAGQWLANLARENQHPARPLALIAGGETVVHLTGNGMGGRNQELALSAAAGIAGLENTLIFSVGSDGTDGPTDAAGGIVDGETAEKIKRMGWEIPEVLRQNNAYPVLKAVDALVMTGPTGTNVNDVAVLLIR